jgi:3-hydroxy-3-methylglutaryl CoA synthase
MVNWLEAQAAKNLREAETCRFGTLTEAYRADAKNYLAMSRHGKAALGEQPEPVNADLPGACEAALAALEQAAASTGYPSYAAARDRLRAAMGS